MKIYRPVIIKPKSEDPSCVHALMNCNEDVIRRNIEDKFDIAQPTIFENTFAFMKNSSLHGLKFVGDDRMSVYERSFFFVSFMIAFTLAFNFSYNVYEEWNATPVIIGINPVSTYINEIPFPAITICNMNEAMASKVRNLKNGSIEYTMLRTLCGRNPNHGVSNGTTDWSMFRKFVVDVAQPCSKMLISCQYGSNYVNCSDLFRTVITDEGLCCAFNVIEKTFMFRNASLGDHFGPFDPPNMTAVDWSPEEGYQKNLPPRFYPRPAAGVGKGMGLSVVLDAQVDEYFCSTTNGAGFKALLHNPAEIPDIANYGFSLQVGQETGVVIKPEIADASYLLRYMQRKDRQCMYSNEANLYYYSTYTRRNCEMECEARLHRERCNCLQYYMPHVSQNTNVCTLADMECSEQVRYRTHETNEEIFQCSQECIPACFELKFDTNKYSSKLSHKQFLISDKSIQYMTENYTSENIVNAHFYYVERAFRSETKQQFVGFTEFLSNTGGLLGLFLGFSVLSLIEIIYYIVIRPFFATRRYRASLRHRQQIEAKKITLPPPSYSEGIQKLAHHYRNTIGFGMKPYTKPRFAYRN